MSKRRQTFQKTHCFVPECVGGTSKSLDNKTDCRYKRVVNNDSSISYSKTLAFTRKRNILKHVLYRQMSLVEHLTILCVFDRTSLLCMHCYEF